MSSLLVLSSRCGVRWFCALIWCGDLLSAFVPCPSGWHPLLWICASRPPLRSSDVKFYFSTEHSKSPTLRTSLWFVIDLFKYQWGSICPRMQTLLPTRSLVFSPLRAHCEVGFVDLPHIRHLQDGRDLSGMDLGAYRRGVIR